MSSEPPVRPVVAFFDGQNLLHAAKRAFGYQCPNYAGAIAVLLDGTVLERFEVGEVLRCADVEWRALLLRGFATLPVTSD